MPLTLPLLYIQFYIYAQKNKEKIKIKFFTWHQCYIPLQWQTKGSVSYVNTLAKSDNDAC